MNRRSTQNLWPALAGSGALIVACVLGLVLTADADVAPAAARPAQASAQPAITPPAQAATGIPADADADASIAVAVDDAEQSDTNKPAAAPRDPDAELAAEAAARAIMQAEQPVPARIELEAPALPVAEDVDLSQPVVHGAGAPVPTPPAAVPPAIEWTQKAPLVLLGEEVAPGTSARLSWSQEQHFDGITVPTPVLVVNGVKPGPSLCLTAAVHGDELNGIEIVRRVMYDLDPAKLSGAVIGVPIVNLQGFRRSSRYLTDRRDLNRFFPGSADGSSAARMAHSLFTLVIRECDALVDIHTGSFLRTNLPQLRADMTRPEIADLTEGFGATAVLHSLGAEGTLRRAASEAGIPAVTLETGEPSRLQEDEIKHGTKGIQTLLTKLGMTRRVRVWGDPEPVYYQSTWVRADQGGLLFSDIQPGERVRAGEVLGTITDPITNVRTELLAPLDGRILGKALNQVVLPGFAAFRIGIPSSESELVQPAVSDDTDSENGEPELPESMPPTAPAEPPSVVVDQDDENS